MVRYWRKSRIREVSSMVANTCCRGANSLTVTFANDDGQCRD